MKYAFTPLQFGDTPEEFCKIKSLPPKNSLFFYSTPKESLNFFKMAPEEFHGSSPGWEVGGGGTWSEQPLHWAYAVPLTQNNYFLLCLS